MDIDVNSLPPRPTSVIPSPVRRSSVSRRPRSVLGKVYVQSHVSEISSPKPNSNWCKDYNILRKIGAGSFGKVFKVHDKSGNILALKKIPIRQTMSRYDAASIISEIKVAVLISVNIFCQLKMFL